MPTKNTIKIYLEDAYYHLYNRGVDKRKIFLEQQDCVVFLYYLKLYLSPPETLMKETSISPRMLFKIANLNLNKEVDLLSFSLMPNHFHLQVKQYTKDGIEKLMRRVITAYVQYFNRKYKRVGTLFESTYKAVLMNTDIQHLYLSSYIHRNPMRLVQPEFDYIQFSSYPYYLQLRRADWLKEEEILSYFRASRSVRENDMLSYQNFVESFREKPENILNELAIESVEDY